MKKAVLKKAVWGAVLFLGSAAVPLTILTPQPAVSGVRAISANGGCTGGPTNFTCLGIAGTDFSTGSLTGAWFEMLFWAQNPVNVTARLKRQTYSGTVSVDTATSSFPVGAYHSEMFVTANNVKQNPSQWDFLFSEFSASTTGMVPHGVLYEN